jgi:hypothetical protein
MASRFVFLPTSPESSTLVESKLIEFQWVPGLSISQGTKSVLNLHAATRDQIGIENILEISTRSPERFGISLSAFNLQVLVNSSLVSVEAAYQSSKIFQDGGPYLDLLFGSSMSAKQDLRLKSSGDLLGFQFEDIRWPLTANPNFYDFLYVRGLVNHPEKKRLLEFDGFTDIAYSQNTPQKISTKSHNCQARSAAIYCSLIRRMTEVEALAYLKEQFKKVESQSEQLGLF